VLLGVDEGMTRIALVFAYVVATVAAVLLFNANAENNWVAGTIWGVASVALGWGLRNPAVALLPLLSIPFALLFGYADRYLGSDAPQVWWFALVFGTGSALLIAFSAAAARLFEGRRQPPAA
jgi:hypothetical protein